MEIRAGSGENWESSGVVGAETGLIGDRYYLVIWMIVYHIMVYLII